MLKIMLQPDRTVEVQKIEWVENATYWNVCDGNLECYTDNTEKGIKVAEFAKSEWVGVKLAKVVS